MNVLQTQQIHVISMQIALTQIALTLAHAKMVGQGTALLALVSDLRCAFLASDLHTLFLYF